MKRLTLFLSLAILVSVANAQYDPLFIFEQFQKAKIHFKNRSVTVAPMNYDAVNDKMYFKRDGQLMELIQLATVDSVVWGKKLCFVPFGEGFLEKVPLKHGTAFIHWAIKNVNIGSKGAMGVITQAKVDQVFSSENKGNYNADVYQQKNRNDYYLLIDGSLKKVTTLKQILKLYPEHETDIQAFVKQHHIKMHIPQSVLDLLDYCLSLTEKK